MTIAQQQIVLPKHDARGPARVLRGLLKFARKKPLGAFGALVLLSLVLAAVFAAQIAPYGPIEAVPADRLQSPSAKHWFGTDDFGRDSFSRIVYGARVSLAVGAGAITIGTTMAVVLGVTSAYFRGYFDLIIQRLVDAMQAMPNLILAIGILSIWQPTVPHMVVVIGIFFIAGASRVVRGAALSVRENDYVAAANALGASHVRIILRHILPNVMAPVIVIYSLALGAAILVESSLSFLGFGVQQPNPSWGTMLNLGARTYSLQQPLMAVFPGAAISLTVFGIGMLGDALRDVLDPRLRGNS